MHFVVTLPLNCLCITVCNVIQRHLCMYFNVIKAIFQKLYTLNSFQLKSINRCLIQDVNESREVKVEEFFKGGKARFNV